MSILLKLGYKNLDDFRFCQLLLKTSHLLLESPEILSIFLPSEYGQALGKRAEQGLLSILNGSIQEGHRRFPKSSMR